MHLELSKSDDEPIEKIMISKEPAQEETTFETKTLASGCFYGTLDPFLSRHWQD